MTERSLEALKEIVAARPPVFFRPMAFFVARCGVLTLVFHGFSKAILDIKRTIEEALPRLEPENEGSMWPKVTLGMLHDHESLTPRDIVRLRDIADDWNEVLRRDGDNLEVGELVAVEYGCRSLENRHRTVRLPLSVADTGSGPPAHHTIYVQSVISQFSRDKMDRYAAELEKEGHRETHYRTPARGWSLVAEIPPDRLPLANALLGEVERLLPGKYCFLSPESRHITIRSLNTVEKRRGRGDIDQTPLPRFQHR